MGFSKASNGTRGKMKWRGYVNIDGRQIVKGFTTKDAAIKWAKQADKKIAHLRKGPGGYDEAKRLLGLSKPNAGRFIELFNCRLHLTQLPIRCRDYLKCEHGEDCIDAVLKKGFDGWIAVHVKENNGTVVKESATIKTNKKAGARSVAKHSAKIVSGKRSVNIAK